MATNVLTDAKCKGFKPSDKPIKAFDGGGLFLFIAPTGSKVWRLTYRIDGKAQTCPHTPRARSFAWLASWTVDSSAQLSQWGCG